MSDKKAKMCESEEWGVGFKVYKGFLVIKRKGCDVIRVV